MRLEDTAGADAAVPHMVYEGDPRGLRLYSSKGDGSRRQGSHIDKSSDFGRFVTDGVETWDYVFLF